MTSIVNTIRKGRWIQFNIRVWTDFLEQTFGEVTKKPNRYKGKEGLDAVAKEIIIFYQQNKKLPKTTDKPSVSMAVYRKTWLSYGIKNWKDLMNYSLKMI
ncbi:MAG: hypothetical protein ACTSUE_20590 [Promethearchaeota archaeon]